MRVTPGSWTLWSVQVGQRCWTIRLASSTRSWKRRSSRLGAGRVISGLGLRGLARDRVEGEDEVALVVVAGRPVADADVEGGGVGDPDVDAEQVDARLPALERDPHRGGDQRARGLVGGSEEVVVGRAAELRTHRALAAGG